MTPQIEQQQIRTDLARIFQTVFDDASLTLHDGMTSADVDGWDSITHIQLIVDIERTFGIKFTLAEIQRLDNVGTLIRLIGQKVQRR
jgi:acyl carrier protein